MPFTYILECADGSYYTGSTWDISKRFQDHQDGYGGKYTKSRLPVRLVYYEEYDRIEDAYYREKNPGMEQEEKASTNSSEMKNNYKGSHKTTHSSEKILTENTLIFNHEFVFNRCLSLSKVTRARIQMSFLFAPLRLTHSDMISTSSACASY